MKQYITHLAPVMSMGGRYASVAGARNRSYRAGFCSKQILSTCFHVGKAKRLIVIIDQVRQFFQRQYSGCQLLIQKVFEYLCFMPEGLVRAVVTIQGTGFLNSGIKYREVTEIFMPNL